MVDSTTTAGQLLAAENRGTEVIVRDSDGAVFVRQDVAEQVITRLTNETTTPAIDNRMQDCGEGRHVGWWTEDLIGPRALLIEVDRSVTRRRWCRGMGRYDMGDCTDPVCGCPELCPVAEQMLGTYEGQIDLPPERLNRKLSRRLKAAP